MPHYGVYDFAGVDRAAQRRAAPRRFLAPRIFQKPWAEAPDEFEAASPILRITEDAPDFFVLHGRHDTLVPVDQARLFVEKLRADLEAHGRVRRAARRPARVRRLPVDPVRHVVRAIDRYLHWHWNTWRAGDRAQQPVASREA